MTEATSINENTSQESLDTSKLSELEKANQSLQKRLSDNQSYAQKQLNEANKKVAELEQLVQQNSQPSFDKDKLLALSKEDPDKFNEALAELGQAVSTVRSDLYKEIQKTRDTVKDLMTAQDYTGLLQKVPDYEDIRASQEFSSWLSDQPPITQKVFSGDVEATAEDISYHVNTYKNFKQSQEQIKMADEQNKKSQVTDSQSLDISSAPSVDTTGGIAPGTVQSMSPMEYRKNREKILSGFKR
jgi:vacuolar-type H+-ATPase subunit I/STV1